MVSAEDVVSIYKRFLTHGIKVWIVGGWGIDALLGQHTRSHKDLDVLVLLDQVVSICELLGEDGYSLKELWSENLYAIDAYGTRIATAFVLQDQIDRELDVHAMHFDQSGNPVPDWEKSDGFMLTQQDLAGVGTIAGCEVRCMSAEKQMLSHTGYEQPEYQKRDLQLLHEQLAVEFPEELSHLRRIIRSG